MSPKFALIDGADWKRKYIDLCYLNGITNVVRCKKQIVAAIRAKYGINYSIQNIRKHCLIKYRFP